MKHTIFFTALATAAFAVTALTAPTSANAADDPAKLTKKQCGMCHDLTDKKRSLLGPPLFGIVGAQAAQTDFKKYSGAMKGSGVTWTAEEIDKFIADPTGYMDGTTMKFKGVKDAADRKAIVDHLATLK